jgi:DNA processing protein
MSAAPSSTPRIDACDRCLRRTDLLAGIAGHLEVEWRRRRGLAGVLAVPDEALLELDATGAADRRYRSFTAVRARAAVDAAGLTALCRCSVRYPDRLRDLADPPAAIHVAGNVGALHEPDSVGLVGARRATSYGLEVARRLGRGLSQAGVPVVSGLALGVDAAAHAGAIEGAAAPVAVLAGGADVAYPARMRALHARVVELGCVVSEMPPGFIARRWCFVARNRTIAALSAVTVVVEAAIRSGSLSTADFAAQLGRTVAAVPGPVTSSLSAGTNALIAEGAVLVSDGRDIVDQLSRHGLATAWVDERVATTHLTERLRAVLAAVEARRDPVAEATRTGADVADVLAALTELELAGLVVRAFGGGYVRAR